MLPDTTTWRRVGGERGNDDDASSDTKHMRAPRAQQAVEDWPSAKVDLRSAACNVTFLKNFEIFFLWGIFARYTHK